MAERMYSDLADWWTLLSAVDDYVEEASLFKAAFLEYATPAPLSVLELGSGGGNSAFHLKASFELTLVDLADGMLRQSRKINPEAVHHQGDMREVRLGELFDAVLIHDAIDYMTTRDDLRRAMTTAYVHCRPRGVAVFVPDTTKERFTPETSSGGTDDGARGLRYLEWSFDPDPDDETAISEFAILIRDAAGEVRAVHDRHVHGLFPRQVWIDTMAAVGFEPRSRIYEHSALEDGYEFFIGFKR